MQSPMNLVNFKTDIFVHVIITKMTSSLHGRVRRTIWVILGNLDTSWVTFTFVKNFQPSTKK